MIFELTRASLDDIETVAGLFDAYRQFYGQPADPAAAASFLRQRLERDQSVIFVASANDVVWGFTQLYPSFSSVSMRPVWVLNDLYVAPDARKNGVGRQLLEAAANFGRDQGAKRLVLATASDNVAAQSLYDQLGWKRDTTFLHYNYEL